MGGGGTGKGKGCGRVGGKSMGVRGMEKRHGGRGEKEERRRGGGGEEFRGV